MNMFDAHCDTPYSLYKNRLPLDNNILSVTPSKAKNYGRKIYVTAFWSDSEKSAEECFCDFLEASYYLDGQAEIYKEKTVICKSAEAIKDCDGSFAMIKAAEGAKLLCGDISRLQVLYDHGVRVLVPVWQGEDEIGGAWDTEKGLTRFGIELLCECERLGIIIDTSHMSEKSFWDTVSNTKKPLIASHSNSKAVCGHDRNLTDIQFRTLSGRRGIVGVSLAAKHISSKYASRMPRDDEDFTGETVRHILHYLDIGGEKTVCLGCDFDGTEPSVQLPDTSFMYRLYDRLLAERIPDGTVNDIFFGNAYRFFTDNLK